MCAIIYANQSGLTDLILYRVWLESGTLVSMKSGDAMVGRFRESIGWIGGSREGKRWKVGLDQSGANEEVNGLQASYVSLYAPCTRNYMCVQQAGRVASLILSIRSIR